MLFQVQNTTIITYNAGIHDLARGQVRCVYLDPEAIAFRLDIAGDTRIRFMRSYLMRRITAKAIICECLSVIAVRTRCERWGGVVSRKVGNTMDGRGCPVACLTVSVLRGCISVSCTRNDSELWNSWAGVQNASQEFLTASVYATLMTNITRRLVARYVTMHTPLIHGDGVQRILVRDFVKRTHSTPTTT